MRNLKLTDITAGIGMPTKSGSLAHIQLAYKEALNASALAMLGGMGGFDNNYGYILYGCVNSGSGSSYNISAGAVYFQGEIYLTDQAIFSISGSNVAVGIISTSYFMADNADPVNFTDGVSRSVHEIRKITFGAGLSGSGAFNYLNAVDLRYRPQGAIGQVVQWKYPSGTLSTYFDSTGLGIHQLTKGWAIANGSNSTDDYTGRVLVGYKNGDSDFGTIGNTGGEKTHLLTSAESGLPQHDHNFCGSSTYSSNVGILLGANQDTQSLHNTGAGSSGATVVGGAQNASSAHNNLQPYKVALFIQRIA